MTKPVLCAEFEDLAILFAAGELTTDQRADVEEHAGLCAACAEILEREMTFRAILAVRSEAAADQDGSGLLLARCRSELSEALDDAADAAETKHAAKWHERFSPARWAKEFRRALAFHPGWSAAALLLAGALCGTVVRTWYRETSLPLPGKPVMTVSAAPRLTDKELETMGIEGIRWATEGGSQPQVEVRLLSKQPVVVEGTSDDAEIRRVLTYVVEHGQRFDPSVRLDSLDVLRTRAADPRVRAALCAVARNDGNAAVRLKALESVSGLGLDPAVQETILGALSEDENSGVRIEAVNALEAALGGADSAAKLLPRTTQVLRDRERNDSNSYVRLRSARVLSLLASADDGQARLESGEFASLSRGDIQNGVRWQCRTRGRCLDVALIALAALLAWSPSARGQSPAAQAKSARAVSSPAGRIALRSGSIPTRDGLQLTLTADTGSVRIFSDASGHVTYQVFAAGEPDGAFVKDFSLKASATARGVTLSGRAAGLHGIGRARINYEVHVPRRYNLLISTQAGDIVAQNIDGRAALTTGGGNIQTGNVAGGAGSAGRNEFAARLQSGGGHILIGNVSGSLRAWTGGGHITAGNVDGNAVLHTDGGHIQVGRVQGSTQLTTGGGNIVAQRAGDGVVAETTGGRIEFAEAAGAIHVRTGGGGVRIGRVAGPTEMESTDGGIFLAGVDAPLHVSTTAGAITARFSPKFISLGAPGRVSAASDSELASGQGDIVVYVPREMALTIDALIERGSEHRIVADPAFALKVHSEESASGHSLHAQVALNGGGSVVRLKTGAGDIQLRFLDADIERRLAAQQATILEQGLAAQKAMLLEMTQQTGSGWGEGEIAVPVTQEQSPEPSRAAAPPLPGGLLAITHLLESFWWGGVRVDPDEQQKRLRQAVRPEYPEGAREAGLEGDVTLRVEIGPDGLVKDVRLLSGDPELARAAANAVAQWRYAPALLDRRPVSVVTTVTMAFRLR